VRTAEIARDAHLRAQELAKRTAATVVLKDFPVQIADSERTYWATWYNPALATGGTGDVLAGIIAALWAQGYSQFDAAWMGVALHAEAGRIAAERHGELATRASHLIEALGTVGRNLLDRQ
jgi:NAD(P)H-hydrate epimerase